MKREWIELRYDGRLYGRLNRDTMVLEIVRSQRSVQFDLLATIVDHEAVANPQPPADRGGKKNKGTC